MLGINELGNMFYYLKQSISSKGFRISIKKRSLKYFYSAFCWDEGPVLIWSYHIRARIVCEPGAGADWVESIGTIFQNTPMVKRLSVTYTIN